MLNDCVPEDETSPVLRARVFPTPPPDDHLARLAKPMAAPVLDNYAALARELKHERIKTDHLESLSSGERAFLRLIEELKEVSALAWQGDREALELLPSVVREFCAASANYYGSTEQFWKDVEVASAITLAAQKVAKGMPKLLRSAKGALPSREEMRTVLGDEMAKNGGKLSHAQAEKVFKDAGRRVNRPLLRQVKNELCDRPSGRPKKESGEICE